ncbi:MAG: extracellular solute-binding protein [Promethearchaeota archaeon]
MKKFSKKNGENILRKSINRKGLVFLIALFMVFSSALLMLPIRAAPKPKPSQGVDLTITMLGDQQIPGVTNVTDDFLASAWGNGVDSVTVESSGADATAQLTTLQTLLQGGTATADVIAIDVVWTAPFADNGWIINLDPYLQSNEFDVYGSGIVAACEYQGHYYAYPYFMNLGVLYYRTDLLDEYYGVGMWDETKFDTWEHLNETANYILNDPSTATNYPDLVGYMGQLDAYEGGVVNFFEWCGSNGALDVVTSTGQVNIDTTPVHQAMDFIKALVPPQYTGVQGTDYIIPRYGLVSDEASSGNLWLANNTIFLRQWPYIYSLSETNKIEFGLAPLPHFAGATGYKTSAVGGAILAIPTATTGAARQAAINLTKYLGMKDAQESELTADIDPGPTYTPQGNFPALLSVFNNPPTGFEYIQNWSAQAALTLSRPVHPDYPLISNTIADYFSDLLSCQKSVDTALAEMDRDVTEIIHGVTPPIPGFSIAIVILSVAFTVGIITLARKKTK